MNIFIICMDIVVGKNIKHVPSLLNINITETKAIIHSFRTPLSYSYSLIQILKQKDPNPTLIQLCLNHADLIFS